MIVDASKIILKLFGGDHKYRAHQTQNVDGEVITRYSDPISFRSAIIPLTPNELKNLDSGEYSTEDKVIITDSSVNLRKGDLISFEYKLFEVRSILDVVSIVNIKKFIAKRISKETTVIGDEGEFLCENDLQDFIAEFENGLLPGAE
jgi:hypothetical protein